MIERCVVVQRQPDGFGLTVNSEFPVYVHTLKQDGAAYCAGVRQGDRIVKVNGMSVSPNNHKEVLQMISNGHNVALTLLGKPPDPISNISFPNQQVEQKIHIADPVLIEASSKSWRQRRNELLGQMVAEERRNVEGLRESSQNGEKIDRALKRIVSLQSQLKQLKPESIISDSQKSLTNLNMDIDSDEEENDVVYLPESQGGPFSNLAELKTHPAHLAVFINYLLLHGNPSSLFFYLITDAYQSAYGTAKEFRRWAFEIFSTFIIPNSPMCIPNSNQSVIQPIDKIMCMTAEHIGDSDTDTLKRIFVPGRQRAVTDINMYLNDFRQKKQLGGQVSESTNQLTHMVRGDMTMEHRVGEQMLFRCLEQCSNSTDFDSCEIRTQSIISSLATVIKIVLGKTSSSSNEKMLDKFPQFMARDKPPGKSRKLPANIKNRIQVKGHSFSINSVNTVHYCYQCRDAIWGMQPWIYFCSNCDVKVHPHCTSALTDACYPVTQSKQKSKSRLSGLIGRSDANDDEDSGSNARHEQPNVKSTSSDSGIGGEHNMDRGLVSRSHSMRYRVATLPQSLSEDKVSIPSSKRDRSVTPSWQRSTGYDLTPADEIDESDIGDRKSKYLERRSLESSSRMAIDLQSVSAASSCSHHSGSVAMDDDICVRRTTTLQFSRFMDGDSDFEIETEATPLEQLIGWDVIRHLKPKEKKRQEVINELFHTERTHVRNLKILYHVFYKPIVTSKIVTEELANLLFANLEELLNLHKSMSDAMRAEVEKWRSAPPRVNGGIYGDIGVLMESMFDGEAAENLMRVTATFCQHQQHALEFLRTRCKREKDDAFVRFLAEAESNPVCRKLQLKDMIPVEMQRLVKYPLLLETIAKYTTEPSEEQNCLLRTVASAKRILSAVNTAKRNAENLRRLEELQKRTDTSPFDKEFVGHDYTNLNLTKFRLVHDGPLTCRFNRGKMIELHVVLLENMLVLFTKNSDGNKLVLKALEPSKETRWSPILPLAPLIAKEKANDKRAFFLIFNSQYGAQIYELVAGTATERKTWFKLMGDQIMSEKKNQAAGIDHNFDVSAQTTLDSDGVAKVNVVTHPRLVNANEITIQQPTILEHAQPVLTPAEKLKRSDEIIIQTLITKQTILAQFLSNDDSKGNTEELEKITEVLGGLAVVDLKQRDGKELAMSAIVHGNRLLDSINQSLNIRKEMGENGLDIYILNNQEPNVPSVPSYKLTAIAAPLMNHLKALMQVIQDQQNELNLVKQQLYHYKKLASDVDTRDRSVSEETLTDLGEDRKMVPKRPRLPSIQPMT
nr:RhoGEF [Caenorhabditis elegans]